MAVALTTWSWVSLSFRVSDVREDVLLSDVTLQPVCGFLKHTIRPSPGFTTRLVELLNRISRRFRWWEEFGASEESGRCTQLSSVCCLRRPQESATFSVRFIRTLAPPFQQFLFFLILTAVRPSSIQTPPRGGQAKPEDLRDHHRTQSDRDRVIVPSARVLAQAREEAQLLKGHCLTAFERWTAFARALTQSTMPST